MACEFLVSNGVLPQEELNAYLLRAKEKYGKEPKRISIQVDGDEVALDYTFDAKPFERIRRITGYLVGTTDRFNNAKRAEEHDRVKHSI
ncbi:MAG: anaerobic ribonucleoside-triphosphate reductase [Bacillota bacterium]|nr:anaerobic ribonucleoside-triphosphate reductase [Bacillota bacterium]